MKFGSQVLVLLAMALAAQSVVVCPDGTTSNCYPQVFQPSKDWQVIREGQQIPAGLHVRLNLETGEQEARLLLAEGNEEKSEIIVSNSNVISEEFDEEKEKTQKAIPDRLKTHSKPKVSDTDLLDYDNSVLEILKFTKGSDMDRLETALSTLAELSHDIFFGLQLSTHPSVFTAMKDIVESHPEDERITEKIYRIIGASLRNNPQAVTQFVQHSESSLVPWLYRVLNEGQVSELVQKRVLGVIHALSMDNTYASEHFSTKDADAAEGLKSLISLFPKMGNAAKERLILILEDIILPEAKRQETGDHNDVNRAFSAFLQRLLYQNAAFLEPQFQTVFRSLAELHKAENLPVLKEFLQWLSKEVEERKAVAKRRESSSSDTDADFDSYILAARHVIFGNPNAARKAYDEL